MRVNPHYLTGLVASLCTISATEQRLTQQMSSGSRVNQLSDDPVAVGQNVMLSSQIASDDSFSQTASSTDALLQVSDSALGSVVSQLTTAISLATEANNGTMNANDVQAIANQLSGIRDEVFSLANTTYLGRFVFAGSLGDVAPFTLNTGTNPATATYIGDGGTMFLQTPTGQQLQLNVPGDQIFLSPGADVLTTLNNLIADFSSGTPSPTAVADTQALHDVLSHVSQQRVLIDNSITRLNTAKTSVQSNSALLTSVQTDLLQADIGEIATQLSTSETQQTALSQIFAILGRQSLFDHL